METIWVALISACAMVFGAIFTLVGQWWRGRKETEQKRLESDNNVVIAKIDADSSERIEMTRVLAAHNEALQGHNLEQDKLVIELTQRNAELIAQVTLLQANVDQGSRHITRLEKDLAVARSRNEYLLDELESLREAFQGEVTDALELIESRSDPVED